MKNKGRVLLTLLVGLFCCRPGGLACAQSRLTPVDADSVVLEDFFWNLQLDTVRVLYPTMPPVQPAKVKATKKKIEDWEARRARLLPTGVIAGEEDGLGSAIEMVNLSYELGLATGETRYFAAMEHCLYNGVAGRMAEPAGEHTSEVAQLMNNVPSMAIATRGTDVYINMFLRSSSFIENGDVHLLFVAGVSDPWYNEYLLQMRILGGESHFKIHIRVPEWMGNSVLETADYVKKIGRWTMSVSGNQVKPQYEDGYIVVERDWTEQDYVVVRFPSPIMRVSLKGSNEVMLQRGSLLYTFLDLPDGATINPSDALHAEFDRDRHTNVLTGPYYKGGVQAGEFHAEPYCFNRLTAGARLSAPTE